MVSSLSKKEISSVPSVSTRASVEPRGTMVPYISTVSSPVCFRRHHIHSTEAVMQEQRDISTQSRVSSHHRSDILRSIELAGIKVEGLLRTTHADQQGRRCVPWVIPTISKRGVATQLPFMLLALCRDAEKQQKIAGQYERETSIWSTCIHTQKQKQYNNRRKFPHLSRHIHLMHAHKPAGGQWCVSRCDSPTQTEGSYYWIAAR